MPPSHHGSWWLMPDGTNLCLLGLDKFGHVTPVNCNLASPTLILFLVFNKYTVLSFIALWIKYVPFMIGRSETMVLIDVQRLPNDDLSFLWVPIPDLCHEQDLVGNCQQSNVVFGNSTAQIIGHIVIPLAVWLGLWWGIEQPAPQHEFTRFCHQTLFFAHVWDN